MDEAGVARPGRRRDGIRRAVAAAVLCLSAEAHPASVFRISDPVLTDILLPDGSARELARRRFARGARLVSDFEVLSAAPLLSAETVRLFLPPQRPSRLPGGTRPETYHALLEAYRRGWRETSVRALASWSASQVEAAVGELIRSGVDRCDPACRQAACVLETDVALGLVQAGSDQAAAAHILPARALMKSAEAPPEFRRDWLLALGQGFRQTGQFRKALEMFGECLELLPQEPACALARAATYEDLAFRLVPDSAREIPEDLADAQFDVRGSRPVGVRGSPRGGFRGGLLDAPNLMGLDNQAATLAQDGYRRLLSVEPEWAEARLHFARYQLRRRRYREAEEEAARALELSADPRMRSRAHLLLGRLEERRNHLEAACSHYRQGVDGEPGSQVLRVALSHALLRAGRLEESRAEARAALASAADSVGADGWLCFRVGARAEAMERLRALRARMRP